MSIGSISRRRTSRKKSLEIKKIRKNNNIEFDERVKRQNKMVYDMVYDKAEEARKEKKKKKKKQQGRLSM